MLGMKRIVIAPHERGLKFRNRRLVAVLAPGVYWQSTLMNQTRVEVHDLSDPEFRHPQAESLMKTAPELLREHLQSVELSEQQVALAYYDGQFAGVLPPSTRQLFWKGLVKLDLKVFDIETEYALPRQLAAVLARPRGGAVPPGVGTYLYTAEVADHYQGLLFVNGEFVRTLGSGFHAFWKLNRSISVEQIDTRVQPMEVSGQEILTRDKVSLRLNLAAVYQVSDAVRAHSDLKNPVDWLYRELQFALRQAVGTRTLDALLVDKNQLDASVFETVVGKAAAHGLQLRSVGVKDVILPGEMKDILNQVVAAEKVAQANVIKRREETAATRSALNTAKLMADNPTLLRLKELEVLEKVTEKVDRLTVFGGLDGVLNDTVRINLPAH